ncbi:hypothetical protein Golomagni_08397, partial [Golovinomyces magnicellulatus]
MSDDYKLYSYFRSSCSARLRIILNYKGIPYTLVPVNLLSGDHLSEAHRALNPSASVPLFITPDGVKIGQSLAALEYLEEKHPSPATLPASNDLVQRAIVRTLVNIINADTQPPTNMKIMKRVKALGGSAEDWNRDLMAEGLRAYEAVAKDHAGKYSVGDSVTMADACLLPAWWNAERYKVDLTQFPVLNK